MYEFIIWNIITLENVFFYVAAYAHKNILQENKSSPTNPAVGFKEKTSDAPGSLASQRCCLDTWRLFRVKTFLLKNIRNVSFQFITSVVQTWNCFPFTLMTPSAPTGRRTRSFLPSANREANLTLKRPKKALPTRKSKI